MELWEQARRLAEKEQQLIDGNTSNLKSRASSLYKYKLATRREPIGWVQSQNCWAFTVLDLALGEALQQCPELLPWRSKINLWNSPLTFGDKNIFCSFFRKGNTSLKRFFDRSKTEFVWKTKKDRPSRDQLKWNLNWKGPPPPPKGFPWKWNGFPWPPCWDSGSRGSSPLSNFCRISEIKKRVVSGSYGRPLLKDPASLAN